MKAYKCDRCGGYFDPPLNRITLWCWPGSINQTTDTYDVCPSCFNEVLGYLKNEKVEEMYTVHADNEPLYSCSNETMREILKERGKEFVK